MVNMGNVWDRTTEFLSDNSRILLPIALIALWLPSSASALVRGIDRASGGPVVWGVPLICALISLWGTLAVVALALNPEGGRAPAVSTATGNFPRAVGAMLILLVVFAILAVPVIGVIAASGIDLAAIRAGGLMRNLSPGSTTFVSLYALVLAVAVAVVQIRLGMLYPVVIAEGGVIGAIRRAWGLARGIVWQMIGVWILFIIVYLVAAAAITSGAGAVLGLLTDMHGAFSFGRIVVAILSGLVTTAFTLIVAAFSAKLYHAVITARTGVSAA